MCSCNCLCCGSAALEPAEVDSTKAFLRAWAWKREHRPDKLSTCMLWLLAWHCTSLCFALVVLSLLLLTGMREVAALTGVCFPLHRARFVRPYIHIIHAGNGGEGEARLTVGQARFKAEGFASTVWDSSIVLAKYFERWRHVYAGRRCLDLSAGCGLVGILPLTSGTGCYGRLPIGFCTYSCERMKLS